MTDATAAASDDFVEITVDAPEPVETLEVTPDEPKPGENLQDLDKSDDEPAKEGEEAKDDPLRDDKGRYKRTYQGRVDTLTRNVHEARREAAYWQGIATQSGAKPGDSAAPTAKPTADQFEDYGDYVEALTDWKVADRERTNVQSQTEKAAGAVESSRNDLWGAKVSEAKTTIADFDAVMEKADTPTKPHVADAIMDADRGPELLYHLARNPEIVGKLNEMSPYRAAIELGRIEATLEAPAEKPKPRETTTSKAPAPITPVQPGSSAAKDPSKMSMDEYTAYRKANGVR
jgi:hypothetical protein